MEIGSADELASAIYVKFYARFGLGPAAGARSLRLPYLQQLSNAHQGRTGWDPGWSLLDVSNDTLRVSKAGITVRANSADVSVASLAAGASLSIRIGKEYLGRSGWYFALGDAPPTHDGKILRVYFNVSAHEGAALVASCTGLVNSLGLPFRLKLPDDPAAFNRVDSAVLYLHGVGPADAKRIALVVADQIPLRPGAPAFTQAICTGASWAEDPGGGGSFGEHRCRLLASALLRVSLSGRRTAQAKREAIAEEFLTNGVDPLRPYATIGLLRAHGMA
jgi:hypothetical protein